MGKRVLLAIFSIVPGAYGANLVPLGMLVPEQFQMGLGLLIPSSWGREPVYPWKAGPASDRECKGSGFVLVWRTALFREVDDGLPRRRCARCPACERECWTAVYSLF
jgi:hypothetical protein